MKSAQVIADALSDWRPVRDAADSAEETFHQLDADEVDRLAHRAFAEEWRAQLRKKVNGVPIYGNIERVDAATGDTVRLYKQTSLFELDDYRSAIAACDRRAKAERRTARALAEDCQNRLGVQLRTDGRAA